MRLRRFRAAFIASAVATSVGGALHSRPAVAAFKPLTMGLLAADLIERGGTRPRIDNLLLGTAVAAAMAGDYFMYRDEFNEDSSDTTDLQTGASMFALAQLSYLGLLGRRGARPSRNGLLARLTAMGESGGLVLINQPRVLPVLGGYGSLLAAMSAFAADPRLRQTPATRRLKAGGLLFMASDSLIMNRRFLLTGTKAAGPVEAGVLLTYFAAQALLLDGLAEAKP